MKLIIISLVFLSLVMHCCYSYFKIKKHLHILQLNSYFNGRYFYWLYKKLLIVFNFREFTPFVSLLGAFFQAPIITLLLFTLTYFSLALSSSYNKDVKKPLVFTARATRLFLLNLFFIFIIYFLSIYFWWSIGDFCLTKLIVVLIGCNILIPFILMFANFLLLPIEKLIQYFYCKEARVKINKFFPDLQVIGITGSFGKTTTKHIISQILQIKFNMLATPKSYNTTMGVVKTIRLDLKPIHQVFVVEMSAKKPGDIKEICEIARPKYGLITAIGEQHLETFKTLDLIKKTKNELIESLPITDGVAFFNVDDQNSKDLIKKAKCRVIKYGFENNSENLNYYVKNLTITPNGNKFSIVKTSDNSTTDFQTKLLGKHNVYNILAAVAVSSELGVSLHDMIHQIKQLSSVEHRLELKCLPNDVILIDDAFNANPIGSKEALDVLSQIPGKRKIIITPGMVELGSKENEYNKQFGQQIASICDYVILVGHKQTICIQQGLISMKYSEQQLFIAKDFKQANQHLQNIMQPQDVVLIANDLPDNYNE